MAKADKTAKVRLKAKQASARERLAVKIFSPFQVYYKGDAVSVSAANKTGPFDILYNHSNFFSLVVKCELVINTDLQQFKFQISRGIIKVSDNRVVLFIDI